jgi:hypothetical protein
MANQFGPKEGQEEVEVANGTEEVSEVKEETAGEETTPEEGE